MVTAVHDFGDERESFRARLRKLLHRSGPEFRRGKENRGDRDILSPSNHRRTVSATRSLFSFKGDRKVPRTVTPRRIGSLLPTFPARVSSSRRSADVYLAQQAGDRRAGIDPRCSFFGSSNRLIFTLHRVPNTRSRRPMLCVTLKERSVGVVLFVTRRFPASAFRIRRDLFSVNSLILH